ncbi:MAG: hypothetical protein WCP06_10790 [Verrucomicrobiota bacterium]
MSKLDLMKDPFYAQLMFVIESVICKADKSAAENGVRLTDSAIKSALNKARHMTPEKIIEPIISIVKREDLIEELARCIAGNRELLEIDGPEGEGMDVTRAHWDNAISAVEASLKTRNHGGPGSRDYLDFIHSFVERGQL